LSGHRPPAAQLFDEERFLTRNLADDAVCCSQIRYRRSLGIS